MRQRPVSPRWLAAGLVAGGLLEAALALAQFQTQAALVPPALGLPWLPRSDAALSGAPVLLDARSARVLRAFGTFPHPNVLGGYLALALVCLPLLGGRRRVEWLLWPAGALLAAGLWSHSHAAAGWRRRSGWLCGGWAAGSGARGEDVCAAPVWSC